MAALLAGWVGSAVTELHVDGGGGLHMRLGSYQVAVAAEPLHEAWEVRGMDGGLLVCLPGGRISVWAPTLGRIPRVDSAGRWPSLFGAGRWPADPPSGRRTRPGGRLPSDDC